MLKLIFLLVAAAWLSVVFTQRKACAAEPGRVLAGASRVDITPSMPVYLAGLANNRVAESAHDPIWARGLALSVGGETVIFVAMDLIGLFHNQVERVRDMVAEEIPVPRRNILIGCTHVHSGPDTIGFWGPHELKSGVNPAFMEQARQGAARAAVEAYENRVEASLAFGTAAAEGISENIRDQGVFDDTAYVLLARDASGSVIASMINYALHPETLWSDSLLITSDFPHFMREKAESELGGIAVYFNRDLGAMVTPAVEANTFDEARRIGETLADAVIRAAETAAPLAPDALGLAYRELVLPIKNPLLADPSMLQALNIDRELEPHGIRTELTAVRIGELTVLTLPGEAHPKVGARLAAAASTRFNMLLGLTNDELGYILPQEDYERDVFSYERTRSLGPDTGRIIEDELAALVARLDADGL